MRIRNLYVALVLILIASAGLWAADEVAPPAQSTTPAPGAPNNPDDDVNGVSRWPMNIPTSDGQITVFQPQLEDFQGDTLKGRAAVAVTTSKQTDPIYGAIWLESRVSTDRVARTVRILDTKVTRTNFPNLEDPAEKQLAEQVRQAIVAQPITLSLDQILAMLEVVQREQQTAAQLDNTPPTIIFREHPTIKIQYEGKPQLTQVQNSNLMRVVNTPFFVVLDPGSKTYFLKGGGHWFSAPDPMGPWQNAANVPAAVSQLADASDYKDPQQPISAQQLAGLEIITATDPTELIWTDGPPQMGTITGTSLLYYSNTDSDVFLTIGNQQMYVLLSGRWYTAANRNGPWAYVAPDKLPADFAKIPPNSDKGDVLAHVAGTQAAEDAIADTSVPQTATIDRQHYDQPDVQYDGEPQFDAIDQSPCTYASNCATPVIQFSGDYYCCSNAVWYRGRNARGPWELCTQVPREIYLIPPSCPIYSVRYCYVYGYTPQVVYVGYTPGYVGCYPYSHVVVFGTGYRYHPWYRHEFIPRPCTFGFAAHYNSYVGHWGFDFGLATGGGGLWVGTGDHAWGRREPWFGYGGYRPVVVHRDVNQAMFRTEYISRIHEGRPPEAIHRDTYGRNLYQWRNDVHWDTARARMENERRDTNTDRAHASENDHRDDVMIDRNGQVYRRGENGNWERRDRNQWQATGSPGAEEHHATATPTPAPTTPHHEERHEEPRHEEPHQQPPPPAHTNSQDLDREYHAREAGENRLRSYERPFAPAPSHEAPPQHSEPAHAEPSHSSPAPSDGGGGGGGSHGGGGGGRPR